MTSETRNGFGLLAGRPGLITGGASGIGRAAALAFAREGAKVVVADILESGEETAARIRQEGGEAFFVHCDVSRAADVEGLVRRTVDVYGRLDWAVNNAGTEGEPGLTADGTEENWDRVVAVNLKGVWLCLKYELPRMLGQKSGAIVNLSSIAGMVASRGFSAYSATKGGIIQLTRTAAAEYAGAGIRINAVCPGIVETPMTDRSLAGIGSSVLPLDHLRPSILKPAAKFLLGTPPAREVMKGLLQPMGRPAKPEEVAAAILWLCSDAASFVTGQALAVDGGMTAV